LKRWPNVYRFVLRFYYGLRRLVETHVLGTKIQEWIWKTRHLYKGDEWARGYCESINHPHRELLVEKISFYAPFESILELGCNTGPNLYLLAKKFRESRLYGIDINRRAIEKGEAWLQKEGIGNVSLSVGKADEIKTFVSKSYDLVFTDATLMYIGPDKIRGIIDDMIRIARKSLIFNEYHWNRDSDSLKPKYYFYYDGHWIYDYRALFEGYISAVGIKISKLPKAVWGGSGWEEFGSIIEVKL
jgi:ubiquinone/menaquinone biosynthesis C-methylase UbiE